MNRARISVGILLIVLWGCDGGTSRADRARSDLRNLESAVSRYQAANGRWPDDLEDLTAKQPDGAAAPVVASALVDPWGRKYHYDPRQRNPDTDMPLLWSDGDPEQPAKISNWQP